MWEDYPSSRFAPNCIYNKLSPKTGLSEKVTSQGRHPRKKVGAAATREQVPIDNEKTITALVLIWTGSATACQGWPTESVKRQLSWVKVCFRTSALVTEAA